MRTEPLWNSGSVVRRGEQRLHRRVGGVEAVAPHEHVHAGGVAAAHLQRSIADSACWTAR